MGIQSNPKFFEKKEKKFILFLLLQKALAVWSPVGDGGDQGTVGEKSPGATAESVVTQPSTESAVTSSAAAAAAMTGTQAGLAHWMSVMAEHMTSAEGGSNAAAVPCSQSAATAGTAGGTTPAPPPPPPPPPSLHHYAWQNGMEV